MVLGCDGREVNLRAERARASSNPTTVSKANSSSSIVFVGVVLYDDAVRRLESLKEVPTLVGTCLSTVAGSRGPQRTSFLRTLRSR